MHDIYLSYCDTVVARHFLWLGRALTANIVIGFASGWIATSQLKAYQLTFRLGFRETFVAAILAYMVVDMVREGARAGGEKREFV